MICQLANFRKTTQNLRISDHPKSLTYCRPSNNHYIQVIMATHSTGRPKMIQTFTEPTLPAAVRNELCPLLDEAFPGFFDGRTYVKQQPHFRIIMYAAGEVVGHVALDYRVIRIGAEIVPICFVIDLCVRKDQRGQGIGSKILEEAETQARQAATNFMVLMSDLHDFYGDRGFLRIQGVLTKWLAIENRTSHSLIEEDLSDQLMVKPLTKFCWPSGPVDMLGYLP